MNIIFFYHCNKFSNKLDFVKIPESNAQYTPVVKSSYYGLVLCRHVMTSHLIPSNYINLIYVGTLLLIKWEKVQKHIFCKSEHC